jgi:hypothetical protein
MGVSANRRVVPIASTSLLFLDAREPPLRPYADPCPLATIRRHAHTPIRVSRQPGDKSPGYYRAFLRDEAFAALGDSTEPELLDDPVVTSIAKRVTPFLFGPRIVTSKAPRWPSSLHRSQIFKDL